MNPRESMLLYGILYGPVFNLRIIGLCHYSFPPTKLEAWVDPACPWNRTRASIIRSNWKYLRSGGLKHSATLTDDFGIMAVMYTTCVAEYASKYFRPSSGFLAVKFNGCRSPTVPLCQTWLACDFHFPHRPGSYFTILTTFIDTAAAWHTVLLSGNMLQTATVRGMIEYFSVRV